MVKCHECGKVCKIENTVTIYLYNNRKAYMCIDCQIESQKETIKQARGLRDKH